MRAIAACTAICLSLLPAAGLCEPAAGAAPRSWGDMGSKACAAYDLHVLSLIEELGEDREFAKEPLGDAFFAVMRARSLCREARVSEALAAYEAVALPTPMRRFAR